MAKQRQIQRDKTWAGRSGRPPGFAREEAIEAAMNLFWKEGYLAVSAMDLAGAMGIQRSSFYNSFGNRGTVFKEALALYSSQAPDARLARVQRGEPVVPAIVAVLRELCRVRSRDNEARGCLVCNSIAELVGVDEEIGALIKGAIEQRISLMERLLKQAVAQKELTVAGDIETAARSFIAFLIGVNTLSKVVRDEQTLWMTCRHYLATSGVSEKALN